ncbi:MAG: hypothetical protein KJN99_13990 [Marinicaulis sp.]|nr:hypothetical protein [Marinicaulis sp.]
MSETLILLLGASLDDQVRWAFLNGGNVTETDSAPAEEALRAVAARASGAGMVAALLPGESVAMRILPSPPKTAAKFRAAAEFLMEDELAEGLELLHIATVRRENGAGMALAVKASLMELWRDAFAEVGLAPDVMTADFAAIPTGESEARLIFEPVRLIAAFQDKGFAAERPMADGLVSALVADEKTTSIIAYSSHKTDADVNSKKTIEWRGADENVLFELYAKGLGRKDTANLLQGVYRKKRDWRAAAGQWRRTGMLAAACLAAAFGLSIADASRSLRAADMFSDRAREVHTEAFPDAANQDPVAHARRLLAAPTAGLAFIGLSSSVADSLEKADGVIVERIRFNGQQNSYTLNLRFGEIDAMEKVKSALAEKGIAANETSGVRRSGSFYLGELQVGA